MLVSDWSVLHQHGSLIGWEGVCTQGQGLPSSAQACRTQPVFPQENHPEKMFRDKIWNCDGWGHENLSSYFWWTDTSGSLGRQKWEIYISLLNISLVTISTLWVGGERCSELGCRAGGSTGCHPIIPPRDQTLTPTPWASSLCFCISTASAAFLITICMRGKIF